MMRAAGPDSITTPTVPAPCPLVQYLTEYARSMDEQLAEVYLPGREPGGLARWQETWAARKAPRICSLRGCYGLHYGRGYCRAHYGRWRRHGDPLGGYWPRTGPPPTPAEIVAEMRAALAAHIAYMEAVDQ